MLASAARATGILVGWLADRALGDPRRFHPVAGFGTLALALERRLYRDTRPAGTLYAATLVGGAVALGVAVESVGRRRPLIRVLGTAVATWAVLGGRSLAREAEAIADALEAGDLPRAQGRVRNLVSRDPSVLDADGVARATVESVAENTSDAVVAPLLWGAVAGVPGLLGYRAANTLDAMVGYRNERYTRFGWAAARLDDLLNWGPARLAGALAGLCAPVVGGARGDAWRAIREQAAAHPSPNAGVVESAFAGALGVRLGGRNVYGGVVEDRGVLGYGEPPRPADVARTNRLAAAVSRGAVLTSAGIALANALVARRRRRAVTVGA